MKSDEVVLSTNASSSNETEKIEIAEECKTNWASVQEKAKPPRKVPPAKHCELDGVLVLTGLLLLWMAVWSSMEMAARLQVASKWERLMEASGFVDWPPMGGTTLQIVVSAISIAIFPVFLLLVGFSRRVATLHILSSLLLVAVIASWIDFMRVFVGPVHVMGISAASVTRLAEQANAGANFNHGYCQAWCRNVDDGLANILRGECTNETTVFDKIVGRLPTDNWCKEAMEKQNYELVADFNGTSPFGTLKMRGGAYNVTGVGWATACSVVNWVSGLVLLCLCCGLMGIALYSE